MRQQANAHFLGRKHLSPNSNVIVNQFQHGKVLKLRFFKHLALFIHQGRQHPLTITIQCIPQPVHEGHTTLQANPLPGLLAQPSGIHRRLNRKRSRH